ncbi:TonB-dependent receptor [Arenibacter sp. F26102]|uniref:SusC/RagA family TonB-linked outer membrane protein n=1 Tax=Arenibacter sp. F26102 TaxID=2926416 RepID=UPI001FF69572|nr:TonB-dependent receptor [Arenibacter sp. F26102]MCK0147652.1 TonB-dependent receptor [Arenibacter sp. F26102]
MKLSLLLIFTSLFLLRANNSYSQKTVTLDLNGVEVSHLLRIIESQTDFRFVYKIKDVDLYRKIKLKVENEEIQLVLDKVFRETRTDYKVFNEQIFLTSRKNKLSGKLSNLHGVEQETITVSGTITDVDTGKPVVGANIIEKGTTNGVMTDFDGNYVIKVPEDATLIVSYIGFGTQTFMLNGRSTIDVVLTGEAAVLDEVIIVGYGTQKKESVVGSIVQVSGEKLMQSGGVSTVGQALTGRLPGVTTISSTGRPGDESPEIYIRGQSTWNGGGQPLILVDGIERSMNDIDTGDIESLSVLKDASATAVFGVKGANGVILITTKRGAKGKAQLSFSASTALKIPSKLPEKYDSYDSFLVANESIERTVPVKEEAWRNYTPLDVIEKYRNPANDLERTLYPNVDWVDATQKDYALDHRINLSVSGGTDFVKYFGALTYQHVGDIFDGGKYDNGRGYEANFDYDRFNYRSNIDFDITPTTRFSVNLSGYYGIQQGNEANRLLLYSSIYALAPNLFYPVFDDGTYGRTAISDFELANPAELLSAKGSTQSHRVQVNSDFVLTQKLDFLLKGLSFRGSLSYDNNFSGSGGVKEDNPGGSVNVIYKIYNPDGTEQLLSPIGVNQFDFVIKPWYLDPLTIDDSGTSRRLFYQLSLNYDKTFAEKHNTTALMLMNREEYAIGSMFPRYREDWVGRVTYNYDNRYFIDVNGAYNGSEKYGPGYKFELFPSVALGWMVSNEPFLENSTWLDKFKIRGSYGIVGDDSSGNRWAYISQWASGGKAFMNNSNLWGAKSPYTFYKESVIGNQFLQWETSEKANVGFEFSMLKNAISLELDLFKEDRHDIIVPANNRSVPSFIGFDPADVNIGETTVEGVELTLNLKHQLTVNWNVWSEFTFTKAKDEIIYKEDPELKEAYQKSQGFAIGQPREVIRGELMTSWDEVYGSTPMNNNQASRRPGFYDEIDFNSDGLVNGDDNAPYGYTVRPQNSYSLGLGTGYKNWSFMVQFYGVNNVNKLYEDRTFVGEKPLFFEFKSDYWSVDNPRGTEVLPSWASAAGGTDSYRNWYDSSFVRLNNLELGYTFKTEQGSQYKLYVSGNNLAFWSDLPDDRQNNTGNQDQFRGNYPTFKRFNLGLNINF